MWISSTACLLVLTAGVRSLGSSTPPSPQNADSSNPTFAHSHSSRFPPPSPPGPPLWLKSFQILDLQNTPLSKKLYKRIAFSSSLPEKKPNNYTSRDFDTKKEVWITFFFKVGWRTFKLTDGVMQLQMWMAPNSIRQELAAWTAAGSLQKQRQWWWEIIAEGTADCNHRFIIH